MNNFPNHKQELEACSRLQGASIAEVEEHLVELLVWLQDMNWPVAAHVVNKLQNCGKALIEPVSNILYGDDGTWKYFIISGFLPNVNSEVWAAIKPHVERLVNEPSAVDIQEEVNIVAEELIMEKLKNA
jgi:hypothetical protein